ncbi:MAG: NAD(P)H-hydrate dehydratase [Oscillospiraceae bacterium]
MTEINIGFVKGMIPKRNEESHKGDYGKVLLVCGCGFYRGAAALSTLGALRAGAGIACLAAEENVIASVASIIPEAIFLPLPHDSELKSRAQSYSTCVLGCGKEDNKETLATMKNVIINSTGNVILDAGGLTSCKDELSLLNCLKGRCVVTPHFGEMAALLKKSLGEISENPQKTAQEFSEKYGVIVVLKSHRTIVAAPNGGVFINTTGNAGLARGGSGDILAGIIGGLSACKIPLADAAKAGVFLHGLAADRTAAKKSMQGMLPSDILEELPLLFLEMGL